MKDKRSVGEVFWVVFLVMLWALALGLTVLVVKLTFFD